MTEEQPPRISVIDPVGPAFEQVKLVLFRPFDFGRWFVIGFCAWLANLGQGGFSFNFNFSHRQKRGTFQAERFFHDARQFTTDNLVWIIPLAVAVVIFSIILWLVLLWLSSRGRFTFLHCVAQDKAEVKVPWKKFRRHANSLFVFRIVLDLAGFGAIVLPALLGGLFIVMAVRATGSRIALVVGAVIALLVLFVIAIAFAVVQKFTKDFVVPIMFLHSTSCLAAWREFLRLLSAKKGVFTLYILFQIVIAMAVGVIIFAVVFITCCTACCVLMIPYISTVAMLPVLVFTRAYSLCFLSQFGPEFDCFIVDATTDA